MDLSKDIEAAREAVQAFLASNGARDELVAARAKVLLVSCDAALRRSRSYDDGARDDDVRAFLACMTAFLAEATG